jgi:hypothetical protein
MGLSRGARGLDFERTGRAALPETHREEREDSTRSETKRILAMLVLTRKLMEKSW